MHRVARETAGREMEVQGGDEEVNTGVWHVDTAAARWEMMGESNADKDSL